LILRVEEVFFFLVHTYCRLCYVTVLTTLVEKSKVICRTSSLDRKLKVLQINSARSYFPVGLVFFLKLIVCSDNEGYINSGR